MDYVREQLRDAQQENRQYASAQIASQFESLAKPMRDELAEMKASSSLVQQPLQTHLEVQQMIVEQKGLKKQIGDAMTKLTGEQAKYESRMEELETQVKDEKLQDMFKELERQVREAAEKLTSLEERLPPGLKSEVPEASSAAGVEAPAPAQEAGGEKTGKDVPPATVPWPTPTEAAAREAIAADPEMKKHIWERKGFSGRVAKFSNEKGDREFRTYAFELKKVGAKDVHVRDFLEWLENVEEEVDEMVLKKKGESDNWDVKHLNAELYGVLAETTCGRAISTVMGLEKKVGYHGRRSTETSRMSTLTGHSWPRRRWGRGS